MKAKATLKVSGDRYAPEGEAEVTVERTAEGFRFTWKARDSNGEEIAEDSKLLLFSTMADPARPKPYLEQYIRTHIQKTVLKRKNKLKVLEWSWAEE